MPGAPGTGGSGLPASFGGGNATPPPGMGNPAPATPNPGTGWTNPDGTPFVPRFPGDIPGSQVGFQQSPPLTPAQKRANASDAQNNSAGGASNDFNSQANAGNAGMGGYGNSGGGSMSGGSGGMIPGGNMSPQSLMPGLFAPAPGNNAGAAALLGNTAQSFQTAQNQSNAANTNLANQITGGYNALSAQSANAEGGLAGLFGRQQDQFAGTANGVNSGFNNLGSTQNQQYNNLVGNLAQGQSGISKGYGDVTNAVMNNLNLYGQAQAQQIAQNAQNQTANANQGLVNRGLGNTTIANSVDSGINQNALMANLANEGNTQQMVNNALQSTTGNQLQSQQQGLNNVTNLSQQGVNANTQLGTQALNQQYKGGQDLANLQGQALNFGQNANTTQNQIGEQQLNFLNSINQTGPNYNTLAQLMQSVGAAGTGYGVNGYNNLPASLGNVAPSGQIGSLQGPSNTGFGQGPPTPPLPVKPYTAT